jgi:MerR family transcriptional regulator, light-induced transcriptional regulator
MINAETGGAEPRHPIRVVAQRTGLSPDVLRAWEKRYGVVEPGRSPTGQRLYSDEDVDRLRLLRQSTEAGRAIGRVARLSVAELEAVVREDEAHRRKAERNRVEAAGDTATDHVQEALQSIRNLDASELDAVLVRAALRLGSAVFLEQVALPLLREVGELWHANQLGIANEHLATAATQRVLGWLLWSGTPNRDGPVIVVATLLGQRHEIGAMVCSAIAAEEGWRVVYLGADLPAEEIARAAESRGASVVALSMVYPPSEPRVADQVKQLGSRLGDVPLVVGGAAASTYAAALREAGAQLVPDFRGFRTVLAELNPHRPAGVA